MLPLKYRLTKRTDFQKVYRSRSAAFAEGLILKFAPNQLPGSRIGFSVEKKFFPKAVERNIAKRRLRESVRPELSRISAGFDLVIILRDRKAVTDFEKLKGTVRKMLRDSQLLK